MAELNVAKIVAELRERGGGRKSIGHSLRIAMRGDSVLWEYQHRVPGTARIVSAWLGPVVGDRALGVKQARNAVADYKHALRHGTAQVRAPSIVPRADSGKPVGVPFADALEAWLPTGFANARHGADGRQAKQAEAALLRLSLVSMPVATITAHDVMAALKPMIKADHAAQAERVRQDVARLFKWTMAPGRDWRTGTNPADLDALEVEGYKVPPDGKSHPRVGEKDLPKLLRGLDDSPAAKALAWTLFTACRTGDTRGADWSEIDGDVWTIKVAKNGKPLDVPILPEMRKLIGKSGSGRLFGIRTNDMLNTLNKFGFVDPDDSRKSTVHGLRASFKTWATNTGQDAGLTERALGHNVGSAVARRYDRANAMKLRRDLMGKWAGFLTRES